MAKEPGIPEDLSDMRPALGTADFPVYEQACHNFDCKFYTVPHCHPSGEIEIAPYNSSMLMPADADGWIIAEEDDGRTFPIGVTVKRLPDGIIEGANKYGAPLRYRAEQVQTSPDAKPIRSGHQGHCPLCKITIWGTVEHMRCLSCGTALNG